MADSKIKEAPQTSNPDHRPPGDLGEAALVQQTKEQLEGGDDSDD